MLCINVVVVSWHCKSPLCRLHPTVDPSHIGEERGREEREGEGKGLPRDPNSKTVARLPGPSGIKGEGGAMVLLHPPCSSASISDDCVTTPFTTPVSDGHSCS